MSLARYDVALDYINFADLIQTFRIITTLTGASSRERLKNIVLVKDVDTFGDALICFLFVKNSRRTIFLCSSVISRKTIQNTPFQQHTIFSNTEMLWAVFFFFFLCIIFFLQ